MLHLNYDTIMADISGGRVRNRPWLRLMDGVKVALGSRGTIVGQCAKDMKKWKSLVHI